MKSDNIIEDLHVQGKLDKQLSMSFNEENLILEEYRKLVESHFMKPNVRLYSKLYNLQWKIARVYYQQSDEYKKTRGY